MFSPIVATRWVSSSATERPVPGNGAALILSRSSPTWQRDLRHFLDERLERRVAGDEIGLGVDLDHGRAAGLRGDADQALGRDAARLLGGGGEALLAQPVDRGFHVAGDLGQRLLAIHHARAGFVAQVFHQSGGNFSHVLSPGFVGLSWSWPGSTGP